MMFYKQLLGFVSKGFGMLDGESVNEVKQFICSLQNADGGFSDRAGNSDLYYSLFAHLILKSANNTSYQEQLKCFNSEKGMKRDKHLVDLCCLAILSKDLNGSRLHGLKYLFAALKYLTNKNYDGSLAYQYFLLLLTFDAYGFNNRLARWFVRRFYPDNVPADGLPCPALAAQIVFKKQLGYDVKYDLNLLTSYFDEQFGFKVSPQARLADLLSTAVALFALKTCGYNIALFVPASLCFIEKNYTEGAFLSGDGDDSRDSEYTFYGLLSLGCLS